MVSTHSSLLEGTGGELEPYMGGGGEFERTHAHPHMPALVMVLKYVKLVTGDLSARVPSLPIRKTLARQSLILAALSKISLACF